MKKQEAKYAVGMAGEHFVAAELLRRGVLASVTIGNAKKADVIARNLESSKIQVVEVKSSSRKQWVVGGIPEPNDTRIWVFVDIPEEPDNPPAYYVCSAKELNGILTNKDQEFQKKYRNKHNGEPFKGPGVIRLELKEAEDNHFKNQWNKILDRLST
ncbi:MAG: hypothetical protein ACYCYP_09340 [Leptospirales bacterium]